MAVVCQGMQPRRSGSTRIYVPSSLCSSQYYVPGPLALYYLYPPGCAPCPQLSSRSREERCCPCFEQTCTKVALHLSSNFPTILPAKSADSDAPVLWSTTGLPNPSPICISAGGASRGRPASGQGCSQTKLAWVGGEGVQQRGRGVWRGFSPYRIDRPHFAENEKSGGLARVPGGSHRALFRLAPYSQAPDVTTVQRGVRNSGVPTCKQNVSRGVG